MQEINPGIPNKAPANKAQEVAKWKAKILNGTTAEFLLLYVDINWGQNERVIVVAPKNAKTHADISQLEGLLLSKNRGKITKKFLM